MDADTTANFVQPALPNTNYRSGTIIGAPLWKRLLCELHLLSCFAVWFSMVLHPPLCIVLIYFQWYISATILLLWAALTRIFPLPSTWTWYRFYVFYAFDIIAMFKSGFHVHYTEGSKEFLDRGKVADYLLANPQRTPSEPDKIHPEDDFTTKFQQSYNSREAVQEHFAEDKTSKLNELLQKPYMVAGHPHGIFCVSFYFAGVGNRLLDRLNCNIRWLVAHNLTTTPLFTFVFSLFRKLYSASADNMKKQMAQGNDIALCVGGFHEATLFEHGQHKLYLKKRKGFIYYALKYGYNIVPFYSFGEEQTYYQPQGPKWFQSIKMKLSDHGIPSILPISKYLFSSIPFNNHPIHVVYGKPLFLPKVASPSEEQVDYWHAVYLKRIEELFEKNKTKYATDPKATLTII